MIGIGYTPEGLPDAYITTDLLFEMGFRTGAVDLYDWTDKYVSRRYGIANQNVTNAWHHLLPHILNSKKGFFNRKIILAHLPSLTLNDPIPSHLPDIALAWDGLLNASDELAEVEGYKYDLVDWTRDALVSLAPKYYLNVVQGYHKRNFHLLQTNAVIFMNLLADLDIILATNKNFLLGTWLEEAKSVAGGRHYEAALYEYNARNQITLWGPKGEILDYATKQWSGLVTDYYKARWKLFFNHLIEDVIQDKPYNQAAFHDEFLNDIGIPFCNSRKLYPVEPSGDTVALAKAIHAKMEERNEYISSFAIRILK